VRSLGFTLFAVALAAAAIAGCDCDSNCDREYRDCLEDPVTEPIQCDVAYGMCSDSCGAGFTAAPDGGSR